MTKMESATFKTESDYIKQARQAKLRSGHIQITPVRLSERNGHARKETSCKEQDDE